VTARAHRLRAYLVHLLTASGVAFDFLAVAALVAVPRPDPRLVLALLLAPVIVDAVDGPLARRWDVRRWAGAIHGRTIDDIVDYLTFTFVPLLLVWRMGWLPSPQGAFVVLALVASLFGFANQQAKQEEDGFFLGFPSYWNVFAFYAGLWAARFGPAGPGVVCVLLSVLTVLPVRFLYPNLAPRPWRAALLLGAAAWTILITGMLPSYPHTPVPVVLASLAYPVFYVGLSLALDRKARMAARTVRPG
jgi:phosphatidylcholine synthase